MAFIELNDKSSQAISSGHSTRSRASWYNPSRIVLILRIDLAKLSPQETLLDLELAGINHLE
jgi:hypothetical protein